MVALAGQVKVDVCHAEGNGTYHLIEIAEPAYNTHIAHGDAGVGEPVPGQPGFVFDAECNLVEACPCFTAADIQQGTIVECGENFPGFPDLAGVIYDDGRRACSGTDCVGPGLTCGIQKINGSSVTATITAAEDVTCREIILNNCANPNVAQAQVQSQQEPAALFLDQ
jgi:hypothetical protein